MARAPREGPCTAGRADASRAGSRAAARPSRVGLRDEGPGTEEFRAAVLRGLSVQPRTLPSKYFYDERGAALFERICELQAYYPTRAERGILESRIGEISAELGARCLVIEFGSGSGTKTRLLLDNLEEPVAYMPVDISRAQLISTADRFAADYPGIEILPVCADYTHSLDLPAPVRAPLRKVVFFPGSTIGNFEPADAASFMKRVAGLVGAAGAVLIGVDRKKERRVLERAYNDPAGITAAFNLNLLTRINRELGADFAVDAFAHAAIYNAVAGRIEMHLVSLRRQAAHVPDGRGGTATIELAAGESIVTEHSYKYSTAGFATLARRAGLGVSRVWSDPDDLFSLYLLRAQAASANTRATTWGRGPRAAGRPGRSGE
jgi:dimethylhistidine N-methyltransferase